MNAGAGPAWRQALYAPWRQPRQRRALAIWSALSLLAALALLALGARWPRFPGLLFAAFPAGALVLGLWLWLVQSLLTQNQPALARLVPGHLRTLRCVLLGAGAGVVVGVGAVGAGHGHAGIAAAGAATALIAAAWIVRLPVLGIFGWLIPVTRARWSHLAPVQALGAAIAEGVAARPLLAAAVTSAALAAAAIATARGVLRNGSPGHRDQYATRVRRQQAQRRGLADQGRWLSGGRLNAALRGLSTAPYRWMLARASRAGAANLLGRALVGLGPAGHWSGQLGAALVYGLVGGTLITGVWVLVLPATPRGFGVTWPIAIGALSFVVGGSLGVRISYYTTRREQALLMLLPGVPRGCALNQSLAWRHLAQFVVTWVLGLAVFAGLLWRQETVLPWLLAYAAASLPFAALLWRDWLTLRAPTPMTTVAPVLGGTGLGTLLVVANLTVGLVLWPCDLALAALAVGLLAARWRLVVRAPTAFPAGRRTPVVPGAEAARG